MIRIARGYWRSLTSMRTALILLLLLAIAAIPGSLLPQKSINPELVTQYIADHPQTGPWLNRLYFFQVYGSPWFSAIYLLLFVSLVGCLVPRLAQHTGNLFARPPKPPARLDRLPLAAATESGQPPNQAAAALQTSLRERRWRVAVRDEPDGVVTVAAEKGYVKETGNLVFHFSLLVLLIGVALGSWYGWSGDRLLVAGADQSFCDTLQQFDDVSLGARTAGSDLPPFCLSLDTFAARYLDDGQPIQYTAHVSYVDGISGPTQAWTLEVNSPLRLPGANVFLLGHGYAPILRYTDRFGKVQTAVVPFRPDDANLSSSGVAKFPDANVDPSGKTPRNDNVQVGFAGVYLPTVSSTVDGSLSVFPDERNPGLQLTAYEGDLGLSQGSQSVYELDERQIANGKLKQVAQSKLLKPGQSLTLPDGSSVQFVGTRPWITLAVRYDPGERIVLVGAVMLLVGLMVSLGGKRRRVWARVVPSGGGRSLISLGGLARTENPGFADEFADLVEHAGTPVDDVGATPEEQPVALGEKGTP
jgi:cytochrome c biogenesis protein